MSRAEKPFVLLADDNEATRTLITAILHREFTVDAVCDGVAAMEKLRTNKYEAVLLDLRMPQADGYQVLDFLREREPGGLRRVLVVSAALTLREKERLGQYDICGVISKPFEIEALLGAVRGCCGSTGHQFGSVLSSGVILLLADLFRQRWM
jgi:CheY-like chemotaxis protein